MDPDCAAIEGLFVSVEALEIVTAVAGYVVYRRVLVVSECYARAHDAGPLGFDALSADWSLFVAFELSRSRD